ncbi:hypothetical protein Leryth_025995 [Lithospermum erythrorhizon]|nr:hypothetical protein Leryth_025995 [Lithospermum erythrorhizon]
MRFSDILFLLFGINILYKPWIRCITVSLQYCILNDTGPSLSARNSSSFAINPPFEAAANLKSWIESKTIEELQELM